MDMQTQDAIAEIARTAGAVRKAPLRNNTENELSSFSLLARGSDDRTLFTFIEDEGYPILRVSHNGESTDLILNNDQVKLLLRQMTLWLTR